MNKSTIVNIQKFSVHDGPGIRTTVFFKGCPLNCWWCHNPETQRREHEIMFFEERCTACGICVKRCPQKIITMKNNIPVVDEGKCNFCGKCTNFCPNNAREYVGKDLTSQEIIKEIIKDEVFYEQSSGGVTFSGGEPMLHADFINGILEECKVRGIHTTIDTSGYVSWDKFEKVRDKVDLFLYDLKSMNNEIHKKYTGVENTIILENLELLSKYGHNIYLRIPIINDVNDNDKNIDETIKFISKLHLIQVNLLPYHKMGMDKYKRLKMEYKLTGREKPSDEKMNEIAEKFKQAGIKVKIGG
ncbi:glycyl-radical enzyme activating protein [Clostridium botulinum]|uniref:trans-4-hydroxy-L-proline dehydratase activase n=1 Tax=Clostridium botulinum TaxID=1491 RepID=UPI000465170C|nr:trans-4-hydroxy-L-proline dehydratase activase [Clostridium botulinum]APQ73222.1 glycyl-radical enzyme activating family protein [Clostridium botulinum]AUM89209.1 glycyl-radical enzyme activating protein [Clostridium botulinum]KEI73912.1 ferredoxin [Clostridium botulinum B2 128]KEI84999.1 ferredoxin [Clostridium botulinum B2 433]NFI44021.1 glycyl-radical enzyme activating protein [Clostridium botulinum]